MEEQLNVFNQNEIELLVAVGLCQASCGKYAGLPVVTVPESMTGEEAANMLRHAANLLSPIELAQPGETKY